jgi:hypothetical protein
LALQECVISKEMQKGLLVSWFIKPRLPSDKVRRVDSMRLNIIKESKDFFKEKPIRFSLLATPVYDR